MSDPPKILAFAGSTRTDSFNKRLIKIAVAGARSAGAEVTELDLGDLPLPLYDGDLEVCEGLPANACKLKNLLLRHQGLLIASPEYNSSISGVLKNAIDWASRPASPDEPILACFVGKVAALMSASPSVLGGLRGLVHVRAILQNIRVTVLPNQVTIPKADGAFNPDGSLIYPQQQALVAALGAELAHIFAKLNT